MNFNLDRNGLRRLRTLSWIALAGVVVLSASLFAWRYYASSGSAVVIARGEADIRSEFELIDHEGRPVTEADYEGQWQLVFFGFTHCPDICPTTLAYMGTVLDLLGEDVDRVAPLFITVDPERDTPEVMAEYVSVFHPRLIGLTGTLDATEAAAEAFKAYYEKFSDEDAPDGYVMAHSGYIYLMTPDGKFDSLFLEGRETPDEVAEEVMKRIRQEATT